MTAPAYNGIADQTVSTFLTNANTPTPYTEFYELERQIYAGSAPPGTGTLLETILTCYGGANYTVCVSSMGGGVEIPSAIYTVQRTTQFPGSSGSLISSGSVDTYDINGNLATSAVYDFASGSAYGNLLQETENTFVLDADSISVLQESKVIDGQNPPNTLSDTKYAYDQTAVVATSGTPSRLPSCALTSQGMICFQQKNSGNLTSVSRLVSGSTWQTAYKTYYDTGNVATSTDFNGTSVTTYTYNSTLCANSLLTGTSTPVKNPAGTVTATLTSSAAWNCSGGVETSTTDANSNTTTYSYGSDPYWRPVSVTDPAGNVTSFTYPTGPTGNPSANTSSTAMSFNTGNASVNNTWATTDGMGRTILQQKAQNPSASGYDTTAASYDSRGRVACQSSVPYLTTTEGSYTAPNSSNGNCTTYDALNRQSVVTDAGGGTTNYTYNLNDVLVAKGPVPLPPLPTENPKQRSLQYNGAGQLSSVCEVTSMSGSGSCGQNTISATNGYLTQYTYDGPNLTKVQQNSQSNSTGVQTRTVSYDALGRKLSETIPEWSPGNSTPGTTSYVYDSITSSPCTSSSAGDLVESTDNIGNVTCYTYDSMHRPLNATVVSGTYASVTPVMNYVYDVADSIFPVQNAMGSLAEAYTGTSSSKLTDVVFSKSIQTSGATKGGITSLMWESTPHSNGYFLTQQTSYPNGALGAVSASTISASGEGQDATGSVNISGTEASYTFNPCAGNQPPAPTYCPQTVYDQGTVSIVVDGQSASTTYAQGSTASGLANGLAYAINNTYGFPVTATSSGATLTLKSAIPGTSSDFTMTGSSSTSIPQYFSSPSFSVGSGTMTGGTNPTLVQLGPAVTYGLDGEGRPYSASDGTSRVTNTYYNPASAATSVLYGNGDSDTFGYDVMNRPSSILYTVTGSNPFTITSNLAWNKNSSLGTMAVTDTNDATKNQSCTYSADDLSRLASVSCGGAWAQNFTYDAFGNITKGSSGSGAYTAAYAPAGQSSLTNQVYSGITPLPTYDANGNQLKSTGLSSLTWNAAGQPATVTPVSGSLISGTYDALGRLVEIGNGSTYTQFVFSPAGTKMAVVQGGVLSKATIPLPGGETAEYNNSGLNFIRHTDWLGSSRLATTWAHAVYSKEAYAPFGETYNEYPSTPSVPHDRSFTGQDQDTVTGPNAQGIYDFLFRKFDPAAGRWLSPDPLGWGAVTPEYPQSLNRYAYVENNPLSLTDAGGLSCIWVTQGGVSVEADDGDGLGCAAAGVAPDGTPDAPLNRASVNDSNNAPTVEVDPGCSPDADAGCAFALQQVQFQMQQQNNAPNKGTPPIGTPKTTAQCSIYQDGSATGAGLAFLCSKVFPNGPVSNQIRGCLQSLYNPGSGYVPIPVIIPPGSPGGGTDLNSLLPGTGAHLGCFANAAGLL
jgi:RHS repeat-associated protein